MIPTKPRADLFMAIQLLLLPILVSAAELLIASAYENQESALPVPSRSSRPATAAESQTPRDEHGGQPQQPDPIERSWAQAIQANTVLAYSQFVRSNPDSVHSEEASRRIAQLRWESFAAQPGVGEGSLTAKTRRRIRDLIIQLVDGTERADHTLRSKAEEALVKIGRPAVTPLLAFLVKTDQLTIHKGITTVLVQIGKGATSALAQSLNDDAWSFKVRADFALVLGMLNDSAAVPALERSAKSPNSYLRWAATLSLARLKRKAAIAQVVEILRDDHNVPDPMVAAAAVVLGHLKEPGGIDGLLDGLRHRSLTVRAASAWALGRFASQSVIQPLFGALQDREAEVQRAVIAALLSMAGDLPAAPDFAGIPNIALPEIRYPFAQLLVKCGDEPERALLLLPAEYRGGSQYSLTARSASARDLSWPDSVYLSVLLASRAVLQLGPPASALPALLELMAQASESDGDVYRRTLLLEADPLLSLSFSKALSAPFSEEGYELTEARRVSTIVASVLARMGDTAFEFLLALAKGGLYQRGGLEYPGPLRFDPRIRGAALAALLNMPEPARQALLEMPEDVSEFLVDDLCGYHGHLRTEHVKVLLLLRDMYRSATESLASRLKPRACDLAWPLRRACSTGKDTDIVKLIGLLSELNQWTALSEIASDYSCPAEARLGSVAILLSKAKEARLGSEAAQILEKLILDGSLEQAAGERGAFNIRLAAASALLETDRFVPGWLLFSGPGCSAPAKAVTLALLLKDGSTGAWLEPEKQGLFVCLKQLACSPTSFGVPADENTVGRLGERGLFFASRTYREDSVTFLTGVIRDCSPKVRKTAVLAILEHGRDGVVALALETSKEPPGFEALIASLEGTARDPEVGRGYRQLAVLTLGMVAASRGSASRGAIAALEFISRYSYDHDLTELAGFLAMLGRGDSGRRKFLEEDPFRVKLREFLAKVLSDLK